MFVDSFIYFMARLAIDQQALAKVVATDKLIEVM